jgi:hypothetical protein
MTTPALLLCLLLPAQGRSCLNQTYRVQAARAQSYAAYTQQTYAQPVQYQVQERVIWVPVEGGSSGYPDSAYSAADLVGSRQRSQQQAGARVAYQQAVVDQLAGIRAELAAIKQAAGTGVDPGPPTGPPVVPPTQPPGNPPPNPDPNRPPAPPQPPKRGEPDAATIREWTNDAVAVLQKNCAKCHGGENPKKGFRIFDQAGNLALQSPLSYDAITGETRYFRMPQNGTALSEDDQEKLDRWADLHRDEANAYIRSLLKTGAPPAAPLPAAAPLPPPVPQPGVIRQ